MADSNSSSERVTTLCSHNSTIAKRVSSTDGTPLVQPEKIRNRCSTYHHGSRHDGRSDKFYNLHDPPPLGTISQCISGFIRGTSTFLYILPEYEAMELINAIYHPGAGRNRSTNSKLCEILSIAAVGSQYEEAIDQEIQIALFRSAKWYLDSGFGREDGVLKKMRTSMLVGLYLIFEKSFWARDYIGRYPNLLAGLFLVSSQDTKLSSS